MAGLKYDVLEPLALVILTFWLQTVLAVAQFDSQQVSGYGTSISNAIMLAVSPGVDSAKASSEVGQVVNIVLEDPNLFNILASANSYAFQDLGIETAHFLSLYSQFKSYLPTLEGSPQWVSITGLVDNALQNFDRSAALRYVSSTLSFELNFLTSKVSVASASNPAFATTVDDFVITVTGLASALGFLGPLSAAVTTSKASATTTLPISSSPIAQSITSSSGPSESLSSSSPVLSSLESSNLATSAFTQTTSELDSSVVPSINPTNILLDSSALSNILVSAELSESVTSPAAVGLETFPGSRVSRSAIPTISNDPDTTVLFIYSNFGSYIAHPSVTTSDDEVVSSSSLESSVPTSIAEESSFASFTDVESSSASSIVAESSLAPTSSYSYILDSTSSTPVALSSIYSAILSTANSGLTLLNSSEPSSTTLFVSSSTSATDLANSYQESILSTYVTDITESTESYSDTIPIIVSTLASPNSTTTITLTPSLTTSYTVYTTVTNGITRTLSRPVTNIDTLPYESRSSIISFATAGLSSNAVSFDSVQPAISSEEQLSSSDFTSASYQESSVVEIISTAQTTDGPVATNSITDSFSLPTTYAQSITVGGSSEALETDSTLTLTRTLTYTRPGTLSPMTDPTQASIVSYVSQPDTTITLTQTLTRVIHTGKGNVTTASISDVAQVNGQSKSLMLSICQLAATLIFSLIFLTVL